MIDKRLLLRAWQDLAGQHLRAGNATAYFVCIKNANRVYNQYLK